jgi:hypothetical protein
MRWFFVGVAGLLAVAVVVVLAVSLLRDDGGQEDTEATVAAGARELHEKSRYRRLPIREMDCRHIGGGQWECRYEAGRNRCYVSVAGADGEDAYFAGPVCGPE